MEFTFTPSAKGAPHTLPLVTAVQAIVIIIIMAAMAATVVTFTPIQVQIRAH